MKTGEQVDHSALPDEISEQLATLWSRFFTVWPTVPTRELVDERPVYNWRGASSFTVEETVRVAAPLQSIAAMAIMRGPSEWSARLSELEGVVWSKSDRARPGANAAEQLLQGNKITPIEEGTELHALLQHSLRTTHAATHATYSTELVQAFELAREGEEEAFVDHGARYLLWHGSRLQNWRGILTQGLRIAPPEAPLTGYMFGKGIYLGINSSKSLNYCFATKDQPEGLVMLCDVSTGRPYNRLSPEYEAAERCKNEGYHCSWGRGKTVTSFRPLPGEPELQIPVGPVVPRDLTPYGSEWGALLYDEIVVYDTRQVRQRFLLRVRLHFEG